MPVPGSRSNSRNLDRFSLDGCAFRQRNTLNDRRAIFMNELDLFTAALAIADPEKRAALLDQECAGSPDQRARLQQLLDAHFGSSPLLDQPLGARTITKAGEAVTGDYTEANLVGQVIAGRYKLLESIGEGGMGTVWVAEQTQPVKRKVALKLIKPGMDTRSVLTRFEAERQALAVMDHPNIAKVLDGGQTDSGRPYFVMEYVKGVPITEYCDTAQLSVPERLHLFVQVCQAVQHAHQKGIIHRDLKPSNILVAPYDDKPVPKVIDFGLAKAMHHSLAEQTLHTAHEMVLGTPLYMSPEQAQLNNLDVDTRSDIYSLGVLLYELLTGTTPLERKRFKQAAWEEIRRIIREEEPPRPSKRLSSTITLPSLAACRQTEPAILTRLVRGDLDWIVMKALEKQRARRYDTANAFAADVQRYLTGEAVLAVPPSAGYRMRKFVQRHRAAVLTAATFAGLLIVAVVVSAWQAVIATRAEKEANNQRDVADKARVAESRARQQADDARRETEAALNDARRLTARMTYERAQSLCEEGKADLGLLWMARSLEVTPPGADDLDRAIRTSMNLWAQKVNTIRSVPATKEWKGPVMDYAVSPDGLSLLLIDYRGLVKLIELSTGMVRLLLPLEKDAAPPRHLLHVAYSSDGRFVAATRGDQRARIWSAANGQVVGKPLVHDEPIRGLAFDPAGRILAAASGKGIRFWSIERGAPDGEPLLLQRTGQAPPAADQAALEQEARGVEFSADGRRLLAWSYRFVFVWDLKSRKLLYYLDAKDGGFHHACFSPNCQLILSSGVQVVPGTNTRLSTAQLWETETGKPVGARMQWLDDRNVFGRRRGSFRPDGEVVVTGGFPLHLWQVPTGKPLGALPGFSAMGSELPVFLGGGKVIATLDLGGGHSLTMVAPGLVPVQTLRGLDTELRSLDVGPDGRSLVTTAFKRPRRIYRMFDLGAARALGGPIEVEESATSPPAFSPDGRSVAIPEGKNGCRIRATTNGQPREPRVAMNAAIAALAFSADSRILAVGDLDGEVRLWDTMTGQAVAAPIRHRYAIRKLEFTPDGRKLLVAGGRRGSIYGEARVWDADSGRPLGPSLDITGEVHDAALSPDGKHFATGAFELILWDVATSQRIWTAPVYGLTRQLSFSRDGRHILAAHGEENAARLYDARTGKPTSPLLQHQERVRNACLSADGSLVLTCSTDKKARLWDVATGLPVGSPWTNVTSEMTGCFTPDGRSVLLQEDDVTTRWEIPAPLEGSPERIRLAVETGMRLSLDTSGGAKPLSPTVRLDPAHKGKLMRGPDPSLPAVKRLEELGGPPGLFRR
jgi:WD40 repeat protein/tRNA A-37 threonylcarbamoyl transferase component Bud32